MPDISVRRIDEEVYERLRSRARRHGVSMEEEVRRILGSAVNAPERLGDLAMTLFGDSGIGLDLPEREIHEPVDFT